MTTLVRLIFLSLEKQYDSVFEALEDLVSRGRTLSTSTTSSRWFALFFPAGSSL